MRLSGSKKGGTMGIENNECVIATTWNKEAIENIKQWITSLDLTLQPLFTILPSLINGKQTIILAPDGSKKGWKTAQIGNDLRDSFINKLKGFDYEDGSNPFAFVEVGYGEFGQKALRGNCTNRYGDVEYYEMEED